MTRPGITHRTFVSYIDKSREYYLDKGYGNPYRWAHHDDVPFARLPKPLADCRLGLVTTAAPNEQGGKVRVVYNGPIEPPPDLYTQHLFWHKKATHTDDPGSYLPIGHLEGLVQTGRLGSLSPRFYGIPTRYSQRETNEQNAPAILNACREDQVDIALLIPL